VRPTYQLRPAGSGCGSRSEKCESGAAL